MTVPDVDRLIPETLEHPYLFFSPSDLDSIRERCLDGSHAEVYTQTRERLDARLDQPFPVPPPREESYRNGVWESYSRLSAEARNLLEDYVLAYAVDRNPAYFEKAWEGLASIMSWPSWVHPVHEFMLLDLDGSHTCTSFAAAYDLLYDALSENQRRELEFMIFARGLGHCIGGMQHHFWASRYDSNWCSVCVSNMGLCALALLDAKHVHLRTGIHPREAMLGVVRECVERVTKFYDAIQNDGSWKEGPGYWNYGISTSFPFSDALRRLTRGQVNLYDHPKLENTVDFPINCFLPPDRVVNFADCGKHFPEGMAFRKFAMEFDHRAAAFFDRLATDRRPSIKLAELLWDASGTVSELPAPPHPSAYFPDAGWCVMRGSWEDPDAPVLALKIGATVEPHGHADVGNYIIHAGQRTVVRELGIGRYGDPGEWIFKSTHGHNLPLFDGQGQPDERRLVGTVEKVEFTGAHDYLRASIAPAYGIDKLPVFVRHYVFLRPALFIVVDEIEVTDTTRMESRIHYSGKAQVSGSSALIAAADSVVNARLLTPSDAVFATGRHRDLKPGHGDAESLEVGYLKMETELKPGRARFAVAFGIGCDTADVALRHADGRITVSTPNHALSVDSALV